MASSYVLTQKACLKTSDLRCLHRVSSRKAGTVVRKELKVECAKIRVSSLTPHITPAGQYTLRGMSTHRERSSLRGTRKLRPVSCEAVVPGLNIDSATLEIIEGNLFAASLFPYLGFLYYLKKSKAPELLTFGFTFLLVFVFGTIPAAIYAKVQYDTVLANVDWLHGPAESLLTITNLFIVLGARKAMRESLENSAQSEQEGSPTKVGQQQK
eukprot:8664241-Pyramimonas_sp.AAC.1